MITSPCGWYFLAPIFNIVNLWCPRVLCFTCIQVRTASVRGFYVDQQSMFWAKIRNSKQKTSRIIHFTAYYSANAWVCLRNVLIPGRLGNRRYQRYRKTNKTFTDRFISFYEAQRVYPHNEQLLRNKHEIELHCFLNKSKADLGLRCWNLTQNTNIQIILKSKLRFRGIF